MFRKINYINILLFCFILFLNIYNDSFDKISTKIYTILPNGQNKELLKDFEKFDNNKHIFLYYKGLNSFSLNKIKELENKILKIKGIKEFTYKKNRKLEAHLNDYILYTNNINFELLNKLNIKEKLALVKDNMIKQSYSYSFNPNDPLELVSIKNDSNIKIKNKHLTLRKNGYLSIFTLDKDINNVREYSIIHDKIYNIIDNNSKVFSPIFYYVQNSRKIKNDANKIILLSTFILLFLYIILLRNIKLLFNTIITLASSILLSILFCTWYFSEISIFVFVFGIAISTVAIDYMFHHYFNNYYEEKKDFNIDVFLGLITSIIAFFIISFVSFDLIKQICYFTIISLVFSYIQFSLLFPLIKFKKTNKIEIKLTSRFFNIKTKFVSILSVFLILFTIPNISFDLDLKNLDVNNKKLKNVEAFFTKEIDNTKNINILIKAKTISQLINHANELKKRFPEANIPLSKLISEKGFIEIQKNLENLNFINIKKELNFEANNLAFKKDIFKNTYSIKDIKHNYTFEELKSFSISIIKNGDSFMSYARINKKHLKELEHYNFTKILSIKLMFEDQLKNIYKELILLGSISIIFIIIMLLFISKNNFFTALTYIIFPLSTILFISNFIVFNIMHLFILFVILAIGIDFGIYISSNDVNKQTKQAISYSLLSTFAGFGVLIFSHINALFSIGLVACIGIMSTILLLLTSQRNKNET